MTEGDFTFSAGVQLALPTGNLNTTNSFGIGGIIQGEYAFTENVTGVATSGYTDFFGKSVDLGYGYTYKAPAVGHIPVIVGARYYPSEQFFFGAQIGFGDYTGGGASASGFEYRPQIGYNADQFQVILAYDGVSANGGSLTYLGLTALYKFGGGKK
ncbi:hypothetical protein GCM10011511_18270 [Puia dinghuensis]|uniref:Outer membrane protein beta-barrel domain-containing protein n=2 Tax=Puia dinghuensis TaxID=1792502 RepID=A0A8J2UBR7_9BACT|nr:hypothetical protein GCM10011511_18270 [Puia dinghuensis]